MQVRQYDKKSQKSLIQALIGLLRYKLQNSVVGASGIEMKHLKKKFFTSKIPQNDEHYIGEDDLRMPLRQARYVNYKANVLTIDLGDKIALICKQSSSSGTRCISGIW